MIDWNTKNLDEQTEALFVGGPADGERRILTSRLAYVEIPVVEVDDWGIRGDAMYPTADDARFHTATYRSVNLAAGDRAFTIYAWDQLSKADVLESLITNYHPQPIELDACCKTPGH